MLPIDVYGGSGLETIPPGRACIDREIDRLSIVFVDEWLHRFGARACRKRRGGDARASVCNLRNPVETQFARRYLAVCRQANRC